MRRPAIIKRIVAVVIVAAIAAGAYFTWRRVRTTAPPIATAQAVRGELDLSIKARGEIKAIRSVTLVAPTSVSGDIQIVKLVNSGTVVKKDDVVVEIDATSEQDRLQQRNSDVRQIDAELEKVRAQHRMADQADRLALAQAEYDVERAKLEVSKQEIVSEIEAGKAKLVLATSERKLAEIKATILEHKNSQKAEIDEVLQRRKKAAADVGMAQNNIQRLVIKSPINGMIQLLPNFRASGGMFGGGSAPEFRQGDRAWPGASIAEVPDLNSMAVELQIEETDRGKLKPGQEVHVKVDAFPDQQIKGTVESISPLSQISFSQFPPQKTFRAIVQLDMKGLKLTPKKRTGPPGGPAGTGGPMRMTAAGGPPAGGMAGGAPAVVAAPTAAPGPPANAAGGAPRRMVAAEAGAAGEAPASSAQRIEMKGPPAGGQAAGAPQVVAEARAPAGAIVAGPRVAVRREGAEAPAGAGAAPALTPGASPVPSPGAAAAPARGVVGVSMPAAAPGAGGPQGAPPKPIEGDTGLRPGMSATADIVVDRIRSAVLIPVRASFDKGGKVYAYVKRGSRFEAREIQVGQKGESQLEVLSGLQPGDTVALEEPAEAKGR